MSKSTRQAFGESLAAWGEKNKQIVVLDADLAKSTKSEIFAKKFPERFFEMGISEANMIGAAAGLSFSGKLPFLCSFGAFITGRYDTIRLSVAYSGANVRLIGTHAGVGIGDDGHSQMGLEDITLMRALPTMGVFQPMDARETELIMDYLVEKWVGPAYVRLTRQNLPDLMAVSAKTGAKWEAGKILKIREAVAGKKKIVAFGSGAGTAEAVKAADLLDAEGSPFSIAVYNVHSLKPFDEAGVIAVSVDAERVITVEDHSVIGGLGSCVAETLAGLDRHPRLVKYGVQDLFGESGEADELYDLHGISAKAIVASLQR
ncbi:MAG: transketolase family protein [Cryobacterium sp.]|nr:transketolase family protein [Oligoflexia bacterium]